MPSDVVAIVVTTGIGVSVFVGVLSGVCYVLAHSVAPLKSQILELCCSICRNPFPPKKKGTAKCVKCSARICKIRCSTRDPTGKWLCFKCKHQFSWIQEVIVTISSGFKAMRCVLSSNLTHVYEVMDEDKLKKQDKYIRSCIEEKISALLGETVDDASVFRVYNDESYNTFFDKYHSDLSTAITNFSSALQTAMKDPSSTSTDSIAQTYLKNFIEKVLEESLRLSKFGKTVDHSTSFDRVEHTYEDLLATAILNKIANRSQNRFSPRSSTSFFRPKRSSSRSKFKDSFESNEDTTSDNSSSYGYLQSDSSVRSNKYVDTVSLTIKQHLDTFPPSDFEEENEDDVDSVVFTTDSNWLLQKPPSFNTHSQVPVSMLVPNPTTITKVYIGDKEVDETSDLSDFETDSGHVISSTESQKIKSNRNETKEKYQIILSDEESSVDSGVREDFKVRENDLNLAKNIRKNIDDDSDSYVSDSVLTNRKNRTKYLKKKAPLLPKIASTYGRDYYTKQASIPSGKTRQDEEDAAIWKQDYYNDQNDIFQAVPVISGISDDFENNLATDYTSDSDLSLVNCYDVENSRLHHTIDVEPKQTYIRLNSENLVYSPQPSPRGAIKPKIELNLNSRSMPQPFLRNSLKSATETSVEPKQNFIRFNTENIVNSVPASRALLNSESERPNTIIETRVNTENLLYTPLVVEENCSIFDNTRKPKEEQIELLQTIPETTFIEHNTFKNNYDRQLSANIPRRADNTLIKKIYSNPVVRSFALTNRDVIPGELYSPTKNESLADAAIAEVARNPPKLPEVLPPYDFLHQIREKSPLILNTPPFSLEFSDNEETKNLFKEVESTEIRTKREPVRNLEFEELKEKRIVANRLGQFSKSHPNLAVETSKYNTHNNLSHYEINEKSDEGSPTLSVKDLKKLFENKSVQESKKDKPVHSLTARSISMKMREELKNPPFEY